MGLMSKLEHNKIREKIKKHKGTFIFLLLMFLLLISFASTRGCT